MSLSLEILPYGLLSAEIPCRCTAGHPGLSLAQAHGTIVLRPRYQLIVWDFTIFSSVVVSFAHARLLQINPTQ